jgi:hypothetical protein
LRSQIARILTAAALAWLALPPAHAAEADADPGVVATGSADGERVRPPSSERGNERQRDRDRNDTGRTGDDLESCKRDADGMRGPERSRFMTQCLKERK